MAFRSMLHGGQSNLKNLLWKALNFVLSYENTFCTLPIFPGYSTFGYIMTLPTSYRQRNIHELLSPVLFNSQILWNLHLYTVDIVIGLGD